MADRTPVTLNRQYAPAPSVERGKSCHIGGDPKNKQRIVYTSGQLVLLRNVAVCVFGKTKNSQSRTLLTCLSMENTNTQLYAPE